MQKKEDKEYDIIDTKYKVKKFFKLIYRGIDLEKEQIRTLSTSNNYTKESYFNNIDELISYSTSKYVHFNNTYFQLGTTNGMGKSENVEKYYCLGFDFDKKDIEGLEISHIRNIFSKNKLTYHIIIDSGNGYHVYVLIEPTSNKEMYMEVYRTLVEKLGADPNACKPTQILRIPYTKNIKGIKPKSVNIVSMNSKKDLEKFKPYDIEFLYKKNCINKAIEPKSNTQSKYTLESTNLPMCIQKAIEEGTQEGQGLRYKTMCNIIVALRKANKSLNEIQKVIKEWSAKSGNYSQAASNRIENIYNNKISLELSCENCLEWDNCKLKAISNFEYEENEQLITLNETNTSKLKHSTRKGAKVMNGNELLIYCLLFNHNDGLTREEITQELTYVKKKKVQNIVMSERTLKTTLKSLEENDFIEVIKGNTRAKIPNLYKLKSDRSKIELRYNVSISATYECIKGRISTEEFRLYNYMRYLHHKEQRENIGALKGNLYQINQTQLAKDFGVTQQRISQMIESLLEEKLLSIWYRQQSKNNGFEYYVYRLNY